MPFEEILPLTGPLSLLWVLNTLCDRAVARKEPLMLEPQGGTPPRWVAYLGTTASAAFESREDAIADLERRTR